MAVRQYIGARYVPKFADPVEYNPALSYEALTIVNYLNNSFTSKKPVPAGITPANTEYWANTGNYNAQVNELTERVNSLEDAFGSESVQLRQYAYKRKFVFIGDSYGIQTVNWIDVTIANLGLTSAQYKKAASGGAGFTTLASGGLFINIFNQLITEVDNDVTDVVVCGGVNDFQAESTAISAGIIAFKNAVLSKCPNATVHLGMISWSKQPNQILQLAKVLSAYKFTCTTNPRMNYLQGVEMAMHRYNNFQEDGLHPNAEGGRMIAFCVSTALKNGRASNPYFKRNWSASQLTGSTELDLTISTGTFDCWIDEDNAYLGFSEMIIEPKEGQSPGPATFHKVFDFPDDTYVIGGNAYAAITAFPTIWNNSSMGFVELCAYNGGLYVRWNNLPEGFGTQFARAIIKGGSMIYPLMYAQ